MRHLARGRGVLRELDDLRGPMASVFDYFARQQRQLGRYHAKYGALSDSDEHGSNEGSTTEQG